MSPLPHWLRDPVLLCLFSNISLGLKLSAWIRSKIVTMRLCIQISSHWVVLIHHIVAPLVEVCCFWSYWFDRRSRRPCVASWSWRFFGAAIIWERVHVVLVFIHYWVVGVSNKLAPVEHCPWRSLRLLLCLPVSVNVLHYVLWIGILNVSANSRLLKFAVPCNQRTQFFGMIWMPLINTNQVRSLWPLLVALYSHEVWRLRRFSLELSTCPIWDVWSSASSLRGPWQLRLRRKVLWLLSILKYAVCSG